MFSNLQGTILDKIRSPLKRNSSIVEARTLLAYTACTIERTKMKLGRNQLLNFWIWTVHRVRSFFRAKFLDPQSRQGKNSTYDERSLTPPFSCISWIVRHSGIGHISFTYPTGSNRLFFPGPSSTDSWNGILENSGGKFLLCCYSPIFNFNSSYRYRLRVATPSMRDFFF